MCRCVLLRFAGEDNEAVFCELIIQLPHLHVKRFKFFCHSHTGRLADIRNLEKNLLNALSRNGAWLEAARYVLRAVLQRLGDRNCDMQAWAWQPSSLESALWPEALVVASRTGPSFVFEFLVNSGAEITVPSERSD